MKDFIDDCVTKGSVDIDGTDIYRTQYTNVNNLRKSVGMVFQKPNPFPKSIYENIAYGPKLHRMAETKEQLDTVRTFYQKHRTALIDGHQKRSVRRPAQPPPPIPVTTPAVLTQQEHTALLERLIKISEAQVQMQSHKKDARNNKFPIFNGNNLNEFTSWYNNILSILASTGWNELYDSNKDSPIEETTAQQDPKLTSLLADLYSYLNVAMKKDAQTLMEDKTELRGKGTELRGKDLLFL